MIYANGIDEVLEKAVSAVYPVKFFIKSDKISTNIDVLTVKFDYSQFLASDGSPIAGWQFKSEMTAEIEMPSNTRAGCVIEPHVIYMDEIVHRENNPDYYEYHSAFANNGDNVLKPVFKYLDGNTIKTLPIPRTTGRTTEIAYDVYVDGRVVTNLKDYAETMEIGAGYRFSSGPHRIWDTPVINLEVNIPIFKTVTDLDNYLRTGDVTKAVDDIVNPDTVTKAVWYYDYNESDLDEETLSLKNTVNYNAEFRMKSDIDMVRYVKLDDKNAELVFNCQTVLVKSGKNWVETPVSNLRRDVILNTTVNGKVGDLYTNIPIVVNFDDEIDESDNFTIIPADNYTGTKSDMDNTELFGVISPLGCYHVNDHDFERIKNIIYSSDLQAIEYLKSGLWQYNETPVNCIIDICYIPFNIEAYVIKSPKLLQFGSLVCDGESEHIPRISLNNIILSTIPVTNVNMPILPTYNDFRDYETVLYSLYLPYYGIIKLDSTVVGSILRVKSYFDAWTTELKYYVYIDSSLVGSYNCNVGKHISVQGNDWLNKSRQNVEATQQLSVDTARAGVNALALNPSGVLTNGINAITNAQTLLEYPQTMTSGVMSAGNNIHDDMNFYLIIEEYETIKPSNLYEMYGIPSDIIARLNTCSGFTQISDIRLISKALKEEQDEIVNLLLQGVII